MKYKDSKGNEINNLKEWEHYIFKETKKEKHWKQGRSAYSIADFMMNKNGEKVITDLVSDLLKEKVSLMEAIPEKEVRFDDYGHGREHDLGIWGSTTTGDTVFIGLEAKVDETFNERISESYLKSKSRELNGETTNSAKRIEELLKRNFGEVTPEVFDLRYQLLYSTVGTLDAKDSNDEPADISILLIIVFKTDDYDALIGIDNYKDYIQFIKAIKAKEIKYTNGIDVHEIMIKGKKLLSIYMSI